MILNKKRTPHLIVILGPTASGKTALAIAVAKALNGEIISADSRQVYRNMDIGTGKDLDLYDGVQHHLIDICEPGEHYHVARFEHDYREALETVIQSGRQPILCGGSGLYLQAAISGLAYSGVPVSPARRTALETLPHDKLTELLTAFPLPPGFSADTSTKKRVIRAIEIAEWWQAGPAIPARAMPSIPAYIFGINPPVDERRKRITQRLQQRLDNGLIDEVRELLGSGVSPEQLIRYGLEYKYITEYLQDMLDADTLFAGLNTAIHRYAKRQMTYFRKMEKDGLKINWLPHGPTTEMVKTVLAIYA